MFSAGPPGQFGEPKTPFEAIPEIPVRGIGTPGSPQEGRAIYIGIGTLVLIVIIVLIILFLRR